LKKRYLFFISQDYSFAVLRPLQEEILRRGDSVRWFLYGDEIHHDYLHEDEERLESVDDVIGYRPDAVFVPGNVVPSFIPGLKVKVFHGMPSFKKRNGTIYHFIIRGMFDLYCTQGPSSTLRYKELAEEHGHFCVEETGWSKVDPLFQHSEVSQPEKRKKTILFGSTFSPRYTKAKVLYPFLLQMMQKYDFQWYITLHPKMEKEVMQKYRAIDLPNVTFLEPTELTDAFREADMMLCDISSIIYEFMIQLKPVVTFQGYEEDKSLINVTQIDQLEETILSVLENPMQNRDEIYKNVMHYHPYRDGRSSARILDAVDKMIRGEIKPRRRKPLNIIRNLKLRKELNYWKFPFFGRKGRKDA